MNCWQSGPLLRLVVTSKWPDDQIDNGYLHLASLVGLVLQRFGPNIAVCLLGFSHFQSKAKQNYGVVRFDQQ